MKHISKLGKVGSALLAGTLMVFVIAKAQGCQRPVEIDDPAAQAPAQTAAQTIAELPSAVVPAADAGRDSGKADSGAAYVPPQIIPDREMLPATKAGPVFKIKAAPNLAAPPQQNPAPK